MTEPGVVGVPADLAGSAGMAHDGGAYTGRFFAWTPDDFDVSIVDTHIGAPGGWNALIDEYLPRHPQDGRPRLTQTPLHQLINVAKAHQVESVVVERRYIDADFRSEHNRFYGNTFRRYPSVCHRLHFFAAPIGTLDDIHTVERRAYRGYSVMRPLDRTPVGRTMIAPPPLPPDLPEPMFCLAHDRVHLFGRTFTVNAMPFMSQDEQFLRCAHAAQWMVAYHAHLRYGAARHLTAAVQEASLGGFVIGRQIPSEGLSFSQLIGGLHALGFSTGRIALDKEREDSRKKRYLSLFGLLCRYVNSDMPPIVISENHAWVVAGYRSKEEPAHFDNMVLYVHDDARGPYIQVDNPWKDRDRPNWKLALPPLPPRVFMTAERAETLGRAWLNKIAAKRPDSTLAVVFMRKNPKIRTYARLAHEFKQNAARRGLPTEVADLYRYAPWPRFVWVVEVLDDRLDDQGMDAVVGEAILDATAHQFASMYDRVLLALHVSGEAFVVGPDHEQTRVVRSATFAPYRSGRTTLLMDPTSYGDEPEARPADSPMS